MLTASAFGRKAAELDTMQKGVIPSKHPHDVWTLDETKLPVWIKVFDPVRRRLIAKKADLVIIVDHHARVIPGYWIVPASATVDASEAAKGADVMAALLGAALPELASPACRPFAGFLPTTLRMDRAGAHHAVASLLSTHKVVVPKLPAGTPFKRGMVERLIGSIKRLCARLRGFEDDYTVAEHATEAPPVLRSLVAAKGDRYPRKTLIATEDLMTLDELRVAFDGLVAAYHQRPHRILRGTPEGVYQLRLKPARVRSGRDAMSWQEPTSLTFRPSGFQHRHIDFIPPYHELHAFRVGQQYHAYPDPGLRGLYVRAGLAGDQRWVFCGRADQVARDPAAFEQERYAETARLADAVRTMHAAREERTMRDRPGWRERAEDGARHAQAEAKRRRAEKAKAAKARRETLQKANLDAIASASESADGSTAQASTPPSPAKGRQPARPKARGPVDDLAKQREKNAKASAGAPAPTATFGFTKKFGQRD